MFMNVVEGVDSFVVIKLPSRILELSDGFADDIDADDDCKAAATGAGAAAAVVGKTGTSSPVGTTKAAVRLFIIGGEGVDDDDDNS